MKVRLRSDGAERVCAGLCSRSRPGRHIIAIGQHRGLAQSGGIEVWAQSDSIEAWAQSGGIEAWAQSGSIEV